MPLGYFDYQRILEGSTLSGKHGESLQITERWQIRVDSPLTSKLDILVGVSTSIGVTYGTPHPDIASLQAMEFDLAPAGRDGLRWILTVHYYVPPPGKEVTENGIPEDLWERGGGATSVPAFVDLDGETIVNAAGDPIEGLEREREERSWTLVRCYESDEDLEDDIDAAAGHVNDATWSGGSAKTWKAYFKGAKRVKTTRVNGSDDGDTLEYIESQWEFRYDPFTWKLTPWDVGFMEIDGSGNRVTILGEDGKPVKQPVGLDTDGSALAAGTKPIVINDGAGVDVYPEADFDEIFGTPALIPGSS